MGTPQKDDIANASLIVRDHAKVLIAKGEDVMTQEIMKTVAPPSLSTEFEVWGHHKKMI